MAKVWEAGRDDHDANSIVQSLPSTAKGHRAIPCRMDAGAIRASLFCAGTRHPPEACVRSIGLLAATLIPTFANEPAKLGCTRIQRPPPCIDTVAAPLYSTRTKHETVFHTMKQPGVIDAR